MMEQLGIAQGSDFVTTCKRKSHRSGVGAEAELVEEKTSQDDWGREGGGCREEPVDGEE